MIDLWNFHYFALSVFLGYRQLWKMKIRPRIIGLRNNAERSEARENAGRCDRG